MSFTKLRVLLFLNGDLDHEITDWNQEEIKDIMDYLNVLLGGNYELEDNMEDDRIYINAKPSCMTGLRHRIGVETILYPRGWEDELSMVLEVVEFDLS